VSYDLRIAAHERPAVSLIKAWAREQGLDVAVTDGESLVVRQPDRGDAGYVCAVGGPYPAEPEDFDDELAEACLAPRWMLEVSVPYSLPKAHQAKARSLATHIAKNSAGAAFDPQEDRLLWPRGKPKRVAPRSADEETSLVELDWFVVRSRWTNAVESLVSVLTRHAPEALPTRYGQWEPPPHRFDRKNPVPFVEFVANNEDGHGFWYASRPSFGGSFTAPHADKYAKAEDDRYRVGHLEVSFDGRVVADDARWREAVVDLFTHGAEMFGAFFAAAQVEPGWTVTRNNRLFATASVQDGEHFLRGRLWQGLPPVAVWLSWYGDPYRELVRAVFEEDGEAEPVGRTSPLRRMARRRDGATHRPVDVRERRDGILVRLTQEPLPRQELPPLRLPRELTYKERRAIEYSWGGRGSNPAEPGDRAALIPELDSH
jgi:hypothetical protein